MKLEFTSVERNGDACRLVYKVDGVGRSVDFNRREKTKEAIIVEVRKRYEETTATTNTGATTSAKKATSTKTTAK